MDLTKLSQGQKIAGAAGVALLLDMFIFKWFGLSVSSSGVGGIGGFSVEGSRNAWGSFGFIDIILFITCVAAIALAYTAASNTSVSLPVALSAIVAGLGILSVILILFRIISPPDFGVDASGVDHTRKIGAFLGLIFAGGIAYGGYLAMQEEGTSFQGQADRLRDPGPGPGPGPGTGTGTGTGTGSGPGAPPAA